MKIEISNVNFGHSGHITIEPGRVWRIVHAIARLFGR
jgi:hypothetical protein